MLFAFYVRRFLRIFPVYYGVLMLAAVLDIGKTRETLPWTLSYLTNVYAAILNSWTPMPTGHLWSLAIEEQFYVLVPILFLCIPWRHLKFFVVAMVLVGPLSRFAMSLCWHEGIGPIMLLPSRLDTLGAGALLAVFRGTDGKGRWMIPGWVAIAGLGVLAGFLILGRYRQLRVVPTTLYIGAQATISVWLVSRASIGFGGWISAGCGLGR